MIINNDNIRYLAKLQARPCRRASLVRSLGGTKPFVVAGSAHRHKALLSSLPAGACILTSAARLPLMLADHVVFEVHGEPSVEVAQAALELLLQHGCDAVVALGGGARGAGSA